MNINDLAGKKVHIIGIGGSSMSGIALILRSFGCVVSGSDRSENHSIEDLRKAGINVVIGHNRDNVNGADLVLYSLAIPQDNPELAACREKGIETAERSVFLGQLSACYDSLVAVCGTHGKTTVTSMLSLILVEARMDPTVHIGGVYPPIGGSIRMGSRELFVTEACEYRRSFLNLNPTAVIVNNIDEDHLDYYRDIEDIKDAFLRFAEKIQEGGWILGNGDDPLVVSVLERSCKRVTTFGLSDKCTYRMGSVSEDHEGYVSFDVIRAEDVLGRVEMKVPGMFNAKNALAAIAAADMLGVDPADACAIIGTFSGAARRFELTGTLNGAELFTDYGHNPTEMKNALYVARKRCRNGKLWAVVQPHTYSRLRTLFEDYLTCTKEADVTLVTDIFAAREEALGDIDSKMLVDGMIDSGIDARLTRTFEEAAEEICRGVGPGDLVITLGCGNINKLNDMLNDF